LWAFEQGYGLQRRTGPFLVSKHTGGLLKAVSEAVSSTEYWLAARILSLSVRRTPDMMIYWQRGFTTSIFIMGDYT